MYEKVHVSMVRSAALPTMLFDKYEKSEENWTYQYIVHNAAVKQETLTCSVFIYVISFM